MLIEFTHKGFDFGNAHKLPLLWPSMIRTSRKAFAEYVHNIILLQGGVYVSQMGSGILFSRLNAATTRRKWIVQCRCEHFGEEVCVLLVNWPAIVRPDVRLL